MKIAEYALEVSSPHLRKFTHTDKSVENINCSIKEVESMVNNFSTKQTLSLNSFTGEIYLSFKEK